MKKIITTLAYTSVALILNVPNQLLAADAPPDTGNLVDCPNPVPDGSELIELKNIKYGDDTPMRIFPNDSKTYYFGVPADADRVEAVEKARVTRIANDWATLGEIAKKIAPAAAPAAAPPPTAQCYKFTQGYTRSTLSIKPFNPAKPELKHGEVHVITGPEEKFWLSADMGVNNIKLLTRDANGKVEEKEKPAAFYVGFNYKFGDVYEHYDALSGKTLKNISLKFLIHASSSPSDSMGAGVGYDFPWVNIFAASVWSKSDPCVGTKRSNMVGISFDLSRGLEWLKSK